MTQKKLKTTKKPWPTKAAMEQVYAMNLWGSDTREFYSGEGSHRPEIVKPYLEVVITFLNSKEASLTVCDLGCGDFNVGKQLVQHTKQYVAIDIVADLIAHNKTTFVAPNLEFRCLDIAKDDLPGGDCVLLRQVLQHLSNTEIQQILPKLTQYKYILLTEHLPMGDFTPNKDIISGQGIRLKKQSGVDLLAPPFEFNVVSEKLLGSVMLENGLGVIETKLYTMF